MEAAKLVRQRKRGEITQEEFFIQLNELRRANTAVRSSSDHCLDESPQKKQPVNVSEDLSQSLQKLTREEVSSAAGDSVVLLEGGDDGGGDVSGHDGGVDISRTSRAGTPRGDSQDNATSCGNPCSGVDSVYPDAIDSTKSGTSPGVVATDLAAAQDVNRESDAMCDFERSSDDQESLQETPPRQPLIRRTAWKTSPTTPTSTPTALDDTITSDNAGKDAPLIAVNGPRPQHLVSPKQCDDHDRDEDSDWLATPIGETQASPRARKMHTLHKNSVHASKKNVRGEVDRMRITPRRVKQALDVQAAGPRRWIPPSGGSPRASQDTKWRPQKQAEDASSAHLTTPSRHELLSANGRWSTSNKDDPLHNCSLHRREDAVLQRQPRSPGLLRLEQARRRVLTSASMRSQPPEHTHSDLYQRAAGGTTPIAYGNQIAATQPRPEMRGSTKEMEEVSARGPPSGARIQRSLYRQLDSPQQCTATGRRFSSSASVGSLEHKGSVDRYVARRDRFGYPLHERGGLGVTDVRGCGTNGRSSSFAPMVKGLPDFYQTRPRRSVDCFGERIETCAGADKGRSGLLYERSTRWLAEADKNRTRKLAMREEQELGACTFQPNSRRESTISHRSDYSCSATAGSRQHGRRGDGVGDSSEHDTNCDSASYRDPSCSGINGVLRDRSRSPCGVAVGRRLYSESKRLKERRFEGEERKRMAEEEAFARSCTFKPCLAETSSTTAPVRARYRDMPPPVTSRVEQSNAEELTFRPQILGLKPGMVRAREYLSLEVSERLHTLHRRKYTRPTRGAGAASGVWTGDGLESFEHLSEDNRKHWEDNPVLRSSPKFPLPEEEKGLFDTRIQNLGDCEQSPDVGEGVEREPPASARPEADIDRRRYSEGHSSGKEPVRRRRQGLSPVVWPPTVWSEKAVARQRPRSAPPGVPNRAHGRGVSRVWEPGGGEYARGGQRQATRDRLARGREAGGAGSMRGAEWASRSSGSRDGGSLSNGGPAQGRNSMSFSEFLARQSHSQVVATQHLNRLTRMYSPSFTPQLCLGSRRIVAKNGAASFAGGGCFEDRLKVMERRRQRDRKVAASTAVKLKQKECTFAPELTARARSVRSRSFRELSIGDAALREAKQRMARARQDTRLLESPDEGRAGFRPRLETEGNALAPLACSRLGLADELDTYIDRIKDEAIGREEYNSRQRRRALDEEKRACTFSPMLTQCPALVRRTAEAMRRIREFRVQQEESMSRPSPSPPRPQWR